MLELMLKKQVRGSISVLLIIIMLPMMAIAAIFVDASGYEMSKAMISSASDLTMNTALTYYDEVLQEVYGIFAVSADSEELSKNLETYFVDSLIANGIVRDKDEYNNSEMLKRLGATFSGNMGEVIDIDLAKEKAVMLKGLEGTQATEPDVLKTQIVEFMKYRTPIYGTMSLLDGISSLKKISEQTKVTKAKVEVSEAIGDFNESCENAYDKIDEALDYYESNISDFVWLNNYSESFYGDVNFVIKYLYEYDWLKPEYWIDYKVGISDQELLYKSNFYDWRDGKYFTFNIRHSDFQISNQERFSCKEEGVLIDSFLLTNEEKKNASDYMDELIDEIQQTSTWQSMINIEETLFNEKEFRQAMAPEFWNFIDNYNSLNTDDRVKKVDACYDYLCDEDMNSTSDDYIYENFMESVFNFSEEARYIKYYFGERMDKAEHYCEFVNGDINRIIGIIKEYQNKLIVAKSAVVTIYNHLSEVDEKNNEFSTAITNYEAGETDSFSSNMTNEYEYNKQSFSKEEIEKLEDKLANMESKADELLKKYEGITYGGTSVKDIDCLVDAYNAYRSTGQEYYIPEYTYDSIINNISENEYNFWKYLKNTFEKADDEASDDGKKASDIVTGAKDNADSALNTDVKDGEESIRVGGFGEYDTSKLPSSLETIENTKSVDTSKISIGGGSGKAGKYKGFSSMLTNMSIVVSSLFTMGGIEEALEDARDNLFVTDYTFQMFSYYTYEKEKKSEEDRVTVTNKAVNMSNNQLYGAEVEYIIFGGTDAKDSVDKALGYIFAIRFMCNSAYAITSGEIDAITVPPSVAIQTATCGVVPYKLPEIVFELALALAETFVDVENLKNGDSVSLFKNKNTWSMSITGGINLAKEAIQEKVAEEVADTTNQFVSSFNSLVDSAGGMVTTNVDQWVSDYEDAINGAVEEGVSSIVSELTTGLINEIEEELVKYSSGIDVLEAQTIIDEAWAVANTYVEGLGMDNIVYKVFKDETANGEFYNVLLLYKPELEIAINELKLKKETALTTVRNLQSKISSEISGKITGIVSSCGSTITNKVTELTNEYSSQLKSYVGDSAQVAADKVIEITNDNIEVGANALISRLGVEGQKEGTGSVKTNSLLSFSYTDYLRMFLFLKLSTNSDNVMKRLADIIQMNVAKQSEKPEFMLSSHYTYVQLDANVRYNTLFLSSDWFEKVSGEKKSGLDISYSGIRGY